ncbi:hypothetical protein [Planomicrobium sp. MB-3u-38]|nr:hypothetical protein [Planomicrobium sp. MB-3u-38]
MTTKLCSAFAITAKAEATRRAGRWSLDTRKADSGSAFEKFCKQKE